MASTPNYRRVLLKVSGEALMGSQSYGIDISTVDRIAADVKEAVSAGTQLCMVIGAATSSAGSRVRRAASIAPQPTTWACSRQ